MVVQLHIAHDAGHLVLRWRTAVIAMAAELAAALMALVSLDVAATSDSVSTVIDSGPVCSMRAPSAGMSCDSEPISSSCHTSN